MITIEISFENSRLPDWIARPLRAAKDRRAIRREQRAIEKALRELHSLEDYQLADIGLTRSDLTLDGLALAARRRSGTWDRMAL